MNAREEYAWAAGFFDGEGCFYNIRTTYPCIGIQQVDPRVLERFNNIVEVGKVYGPRKAPNAVLHQWSYRAYGFEKVQAVAASLWPWLSPVKRTQALRVLGVV